MDEIFSPADDPQPVAQNLQPLSGAYLGQRGAHRLTLRLDLREQGAPAQYRPLDLVSGDFFRDVGGGEWDYRYSFIVEHPLIKRKAEEIVISGTMIYYRNMEMAPTTHDVLLRQILQVTIPLHTSYEPPAPATVHIIRWGNYETTFLCDKTSAYLRTIDLEIDRISGTELPRAFQAQSVSEGPPDLPALELDIPRAYRRAGIDMRLISDDEVFAPTEAGEDARWTEDELHNAMQHHFSQWKDEPQWKLYLLVATHFKLYPRQLVTGIMYDNQYRDPNDPYPRQGAAAFYSTMQQAWGGLPPASFDRNFLRTCVHELGHALNLLHSFDKDRPESLSWMNYPWRYPFGYDLPPGHNGTHEFWQKCRFEFDAEDLRHLRHHALLEVIPGGAPFGALGHDIPVPPPLSPLSQEKAPFALYVRTRPERYLFQFAEPVTIEIKLKNQGSQPVDVPAMLNPELGLMELYIRDPKGRVRPYRPLFKLCGEGNTTTLNPGQSLYESVFIAYGAGGFYFEEPGEYQVWAVYGANEQRLRSNALRLRVAFPQTREDEDLALLTFGPDQGHVLYMRGARHLQSATDELREVTERFPKTNLARYILFCLGNSQYREFKDVTSGKIEPPQIEQAAKNLAQASKLVGRRRTSVLDNITYGRAIDLLLDCYQQLDEPDEAKTVLDKTVRYFKRMEVKKDVIQDYQDKARSVAKF